MEKNLKPFIKAKSTSRSQPNLSLL